jgi:hypothetical protein
MTERRPGWPLPIQSGLRFAGNKSHMQRYRNWNLMNLFLDSIVAISALVIVAVVCEFIFRRRKARAP